MSWIYGLIYFSSFGKVSAILSYSLPLPVFFLSSFLLTKLCLFYPLRLLLLPFPILVSLCNAFWILSFCLFSLDLIVSLFAFNLFLNPSTEGFFFFILYFWNISHMHKTPKLETELCGRARDHHLKVEKLSLWVFYFSYRNVHFSIFYLVLLSICYATYYSFFSLW